MKKVIFISLIILFLPTGVFSKMYNIIPVLEKLEGCELEAYKGMSSAYHIGFGTPSYKGEKITRAEAVKRAVDHINHAKTILTNTVDQDLNHNQKISLLSFIYNIGEGQWRNSTVRKVINNGNLRLVPWAMAQWNKITINGNKKISPGLENRRKLEIRIWQGQ